MQINRLLPIGITSFDTAGLTGSFQPINPLGLSEACCILRIINNSTVDITISFDETNSNDYVISGATLQLYVPFLTFDRADFKKGTIISLKGAGAGAGYVYLSGYYVARM